MRGRFLSGYKTVYLWWAAVFLLIAILSLKFPVGQKLNIAAAPLIQAAQAPVLWIEQFTLWFDDAEVMQKRVVILEEKVAKQAALHQELTSIKAENEQLKRLLNIAQIDGYIWHAVQVISRSQEEKSRRLILQTEHANTDDIVVSSEGLVGLIDEVGSGYVLARTILDASIAVPVTKKGSQLAALVRGDGEHLLVDFIPRDKAPRVGDVLVASGAGGIFPAGLPVAIVEKVKAVTGGVFVEVIASPVAYWQRDAWLAIASHQSNQ